ncbi:MAG: hypothetical protein WBF75_04810 [Pseudonocardiaceae bacterium]
MPSPSARPKAIRAAAEAAALPVSVWRARAAERAAAERAEARQVLIDAGVISPQRAAS